MNEKLNIQDITDELANNHGLSKKNADAFVKEFFTLIEEALVKDKYVKIKGLGTFKLIDVDSRESINVNTGERFEIQGHSKISFTPDTTLKETVNKPFSAFETVVLSDDADGDAFLPTSDVGEDEFFPIGDFSEPEAVDEVPVEEAVEAPVAEIPTEEEVEASEVEEEPVAEEVPIVEEIPAEKVEPTVEEETPAVEEEPTIEETPVDEEVPAEEALETEEEPIAEKVVEEEPVEEAAAEEPIAEEVAVEEKVEENVDEEKSEIKILPIFDDEEIKKKSQPISHQEEVKALRLSDEKRKEISKKAEGSSTPYLMFLAVLVIMFCLGAVAYLYYPDLAVQDEVQPIIYVDQPSATPTVEETQVATPAPDATEPTQEVTTNANEQEGKNASAKEETEPASTPDGGKVTESAAAPTENSGVQKLEAGVPYKTDGDLATHTMQPGESLNAVSRKYYGVNGLYTYIVNYNKDVIKNPDNVPVGTVIKIPRLVRK